MKAPVLSAQLVWCYTIGGSFFFSSFFPSLFWVQLRTLVFEKISVFHVEHTKTRCIELLWFTQKCVVQVGSIQTVDVGTYN